MDTPTRRLGPVRLVLFTLVTVAVLLVALGELALHVRDASLASRAAAARRGAFTDPRATKILFLGDSWTAGRERESTGDGYWAYVPEALAAAGYPGEVQTATVALAGSTTWFQLLQLQDFLEWSPLRPDYVMIVTGANDPRSFEQAREFCRESRVLEDLPLAPPLWVCGPRALAFLHGLGARALARSQGDLAPRTVPPGLESMGSDYAAWFADSLDRAYEAAIQQVRDAGAQPLIGAYHVDDSDPIRRAFAARVGVPFHDISDGTVAATLRDQDMLVSDGWHTNEAGDRYLAQLFAAWFVDATAQGPR
mgnify:CR=1 FL=1